MKYQFILQNIGLLGMVALHAFSGGKNISNSYRTVH